MSRKQSSEEVEERERVFQKEFLEWAQRERSEMAQGMQFFSVAAKVSWRKRPNM